MEGYLFRRITVQDPEERQAKYLSKYSNIQRQPQLHSQPLILPPNEPPPSHLEIIQKCPLESNHIRRVKQLQIREDSFND